MVKICEKPTINFYAINLMEKRKTLCKHSMFHRRWRDTYTVKEVAYAVCQLGYTLYSIEEGLIYTNLQPIFEEILKLVLGSLKYPIKF